MAAVMQAVSGRLPQPAVRAKGLEQCIAAIEPAVRELAARRPRLRRERLSGLHNPWGHAAVLANAWRFLDVCEHPAIVGEIERLSGPDLILWDSELHLEAASYRRFVAEGREGRYWPALPLSGAVALVAPLRSAAAPTCAALDAVTEAQLAGFDPAEPVYVIRYMRATSRFVRDAQAPANGIAMEEQPLLNYTTRPLWLVAGEDRAGNDFVTGFTPSVPRWAGHKTEER
jgi:hypothetical protein